jgi:hypothetical protein
MEVMGMQANQMGRHDHRHRGHHGHGGRGRGRGPDPQLQSAQTFRRGRAIAFLETLYVKRATLIRQLSQPEYDAIKPMLSGELKAIDAIIQEFIYAFELRVITTQQPEARTESKTEGGEPGHDDSGSH